ncbi:MAG: hypothetical protein LBI01_05125, partial [Elusimicrobium sp.]|nr:hypothetical protein [Elusimicrobium sp.]
NSIKEIFEKNGESFFRQLESDAARALSAEMDAVIACGGGMIHAPGAIETLKQGGGVSFFLDAPFEVLKQRIKDFSTRPLFKNPASAQALYNARQPVYKKYADHIVDREKLDIEAAVQSIIKILAGAEKKKNIVIGLPAAHSLSPRLHNAGYKALGIEDIFSFEYKEVALPELENFIQAAKKEYTGVSVTMPLKTKIMKYLDALDISAQKTGAVNTVLNTNGFLTGYNTDYRGVLYALGGVKGKTVVVLGAGGAARAALYALKDARKIYLHNRTLERALETAKIFGAEVLDQENLKLISGADIIINATSAGMDGVSLPPGAQYLKQGQTLLEMIYKPNPTPLAVLAAAKGLNVITGEKMLLGQALEQFRIFTGLPAPQRAMGSVL